MHCPLVLEMELCLKNAYMLLVTSSVALVTRSDALVTHSLIVTTSKALVTTRKVPVSSTGGPRRRVLVAVTFHRPLPVCSLLAQPRPLRPGNTGRRRMPRVSQ